MTIESHAIAAQRTKSEDYEAIAARMVASPAIIDLQHALMGIASEGGELADAVKRHLFYGTPLDMTNLKEESGDLLWYLQVLAKAMGFTLIEAADTNEAKLVARFGEKFTEAAAVTRDLEAEREILEEGMRLGSIMDFGAIKPQLKNA